MRGPGLWAQGGVFGLLALSASVSIAQGAGDAAYGEYLSGPCFACHQRSGEARGGIPPIIGWPEAQFVAVMHAYREGARENAVMRAIAGTLNDEDLLALAAYFGTLSQAPKGP